MRTLGPLDWPAMWAGTRPTPSEPPGSRSVNAGSRTPFRLTDRHPGRSTAVGGRVSPLPRQRRRVAAVSHRTVGPRPLSAIRRPREGVPIDWKFRHPRASVFPCAAGHREKSGGAMTRTRTPSLRSCGSSERRSADPSRVTPLARPHPGRRPAGVPKNRRRARKDARPAGRPTQARMGASGGRHAPAMRNPDRGGVVPKGRTLGDGPPPEPNSAGPEGPTESPESPRHRMDDRLSTRRP